MIILRMFKFKLSQLKTENASLGFKEKQQCIFSMADKLQTNKTGLTASHVAHVPPWYLSKMAGGGERKTILIKLPEPSL